MTKRTFKKEQKEGLYTYLHFDNSAYQSIPAFEHQPLSSPERKAIAPSIYSSLFYNYLSLAEFCCNRLNKYCVLASSPDISSSRNFTAKSPSYWRYKLLSNDYIGLGVDAGFTQEPSPIEDRKQLLLLSLDSFLSLNRLPEDVFGETVSECSLFGLKQKRTEAAQFFLQSSHTPKLNEFLLPEEIFFQLVVAKEVGYYNSLLIKSVTDIEEMLYAFETITDPNN